MKVGEATLRIGIDGYNLALPHGTGVATYARLLARAIRSGGGEIDLVYGIPVSPKAVPEIRASLFYGRLSEEQPGKVRSHSTLAKINRFLTLPGICDLLDIPPNDTVISNEFEQRVPPHDRLVTKGGLFDNSHFYYRRYRQLMPVRIKNPPPIMHWTYPVPVRMVGCANIYTIHDLVPLKLPGTSLEDKRHYRSLIASCIEAADKIVTVSEASKQDILKFFPQVGEKLVNTYQAIEQPELMDRERLEARVSQLFGLRTDGYFLFFGAIEPKKNLGRLIEAYLESGLETPLVIVGSTGWRSEGELRLLRGGNGVELPGANRVRIIEHLPRPMLRNLIQGARAVLFPSLYEGFGLPVAEALSYATPVLAARTGSLPEVAGKAAIYVDPYDVADIVHGLKSLDQDDALRKGLSDAGPSQVAQFSLNVYRTRMTALYREVIKDGLGQHA